MNEQRGGGGERWLVAPGCSESSGSCWREKQQEGQWEATAANILIDGFLCRSDQQLNGRHSGMQQDFHCSAD